MIYLKNQFNGGETMQGKVKFFNVDKGYGFIEAEDGKDIFFHISGLTEGVSVQEGDEVSYDTEPGERGPKAVNITR